MSKTKAGTAKRKGAKPEMAEQRPSEQKTRLQEIVAEEAEKILSAMRTEEMRHKDFSSIEDFIANSMSELKKKALERYRQEQAEAQSQCV